MCLKSLLATPFTSYIFNSSFDIVKMIMAALILWFYTHFFHVNPPVRFLNWICGSLCAENCGFYLMCHFEYVLWQWVWVWMCEWVIVCVCVGGVIGGWRGGKATSRSKVVHQPGCQVERVAQSFAALLFWRDAAGGWGGSWQRRMEEEEEGDQD